MVIRISEATQVARVTIWRRSLLQCTLVLKLHEPLLDHLVHLLLKRRDAAVMVGELLRHSFANCLRLVVPIAAIWLRRLSLTVLVGECVL